ncbi:type I pantothenate kinase [Corallococcus sp. CA053C]|uniref:type I pantothenate kinase n=1 Tax=Corallococcus sp. CA053C TaxID=2316732 RepID=UPI000EA40901|nr:type I pantothenate kinase [Corallococcus sp. CA053C]RKG97378.1 type I pantothenate kinase [Corallococcus sp. CA053C]
MSATKPRAASMYVDLDRDAWRQLRASTPLTLTAEEVEKLRGLGERLDIDEVVDVYLPLSRLLHLQVASAQSLWAAQQAFMGYSVRKVPFIIAIAGSVAVGKSTTARILQALLARWPDHPRVELVTTDGFLFPNRVLAERGIMNRKGFPESYDRRGLVRFLAELKAGRETVSAPMYSHLVYDIVPDEAQTIRQPDILILEGLNVLQTGPVEGGRLPQTFLSDFFDFSIYVDAQESDIRHWYVERFLHLWETAFRDDRSFFRRFSELTRDQAVARAASVWAEINGPNLAENIAPTRSRARLILVKGNDHKVRRVRMRKL